MGKQSNNSMSKFRQWSLFKKVLVGSSAAVLLAIGLLLAYRMVSGRSLGLKSFAIDSIRSAADHVFALTRRQTVVANNQGNYSNIIFLHHSVGQNLIAQGNVRQLFTQAGYDFWDHDYNHLGLTSPDGTPAGYSYNIPDDNTDPDGLARLFQQPVLFFTSQCLEWFASA